MTDQNHSIQEVMMAEKDCPPHLKSYVDDIQYLMAQDGPNPEDYENLMKLMDEVHQKMAVGEISKEDKDFLKGKFGEVYSTAKSLQGLVNTRPHGYPGDFELIEKIYLRYVSEDIKFKKWDTFVHSCLIATEAVRNRKTLFKNLLAEKAKEYQHHFDLLNIASGPCRGLADFFTTHPNQMGRIDCLELDKNAIAYAQNLLGMHAQRINFIHENVFRFMPSQQYDFVWSAGLFDYFDDKTFKRILSRFLNAVKPNGELIIGNFHPRNHARSYMEFGRWYLHHRTETQLVDLAHDCGVSYDRISIIQEAEGINLFLRIQF